jgi:hypothetical protein
MDRDALLVQGIIDFEHLQEIRLLAYYQGVSPSTFEAGDLFLQHGVGDFRVFHGKGAAKATALDKRPATWPHTSQREQ